MKHITRREFISKLSLATGSGYSAMMALGMFGKASAKPFHLSEPVQGKHIIILGAGLAGLSAAYELDKGSYALSKKFLLS